MNERFSHLNDVQINDIILAVVGIVAFVFMSVMMPNRFFSVDNINNMFFQAAELGILSLAMALTIIIAGIDLSIVSTANFTAISISLVMKVLPGENLNVPIALLMAMVIGIVFGGINGLLISKAKIPPILATLGTMTLYSGISIGITNGATVAGIPENLQNIGSNLFLAIPIPLYIFIACLSAVAYLMHRTSLGFKLYLLGNNYNVAKFSGYHNDRLTTITYVLSGVLAALAGFVILCRSNSAYADYGKSYITLTILIVILAGITITGGKGRISGIVLSLLVMQVFSTGFNMLLVRFGNSNFFKDFLYGVLLIGILAIKSVSTRLIEQKSKKIIPSRVESESQGVCDDVS